MTSGFNRDFADCKVYYTSITPHQANCCIYRWLFVVYKQETVSHYQLNYIAELLN